MLSLDQMNVGESQMENSVSDRLAQPIDPAVLPAPKADHPFIIPPHSPLHYTDFSSTIHSRHRLSDSSTSDNLIYERVVHPYNADAFEHLLQVHGLTDTYPFLVKNLREGFPIGAMPELKSTIIIPNHSSVNENLDVVYEYLQTEIDASRMSGPFNRTHFTRPILCIPSYRCSSRSGPWSSSQKESLSESIKKRSHFRYGIS